MKPPFDRLYLTVNEAAARLQVRPRTIRRLITEHELTAQPVGTTFLIDAHTVPAHPEWEGGGTG